LGTLLAKISAEDWLVVSYRDSALARRDNAPYAAAKLRTTSKSSNELMRLCLGAQFQAV
jgi:hypothetical protein